MKITTTDFGELEINPETILTFPLGLLGFEKCQRFQLLKEDRENVVVFYLQSLDDAAVAFSVVEPVHFGINYELTLSDEEIALLQSDSPDDLAVVLMVYRPEDGSGQKMPSQGGIAANINGPLVLNLGKKRGLQKVLVGPRCDITLRGG